MTPEQHRKITEAFWAARERPAGERATLLLSLLGPDDAARREVEAMLAGDAASGGLLDGPLLLSGASAAEPGCEPPDTADIGAERGYRVVREIGRGGFGVVYLAERADGTFSRTVALKLLSAAGKRRGAEGRMRRERQILAGLDHPNVARLLDGGEARDGSPYLVMEYVEGEPIDRFCQKRRLDVQDRLELFLRVLDAVAYAHRNLVVHRDLKPANILVDARGEPKLLDFGVAKLLALEADEESTREGGQPLTLRYGSPEQLRNAPITTASDVYSLGVLLYELLAGASPYGEANGDLVALGRAVCDEDPAPPRARADGADPKGPLARLRPSLAADLDAICLKALRKKPADRYASVDDLATDIRRFQRGLPVQARQGSTTYRVRRWLGRHWLASAVAAGLILMAATFVIELRMELERTEAERDKARRLTALLVDVFRSSNPETRPQGKVDVREVLERGTARAREDQRLDADTRAALLYALGEVYLGLGDYPAAQAALEETVRIRRGLPASADFVASLNALAVLRQQLADPAAAEALTREAIAVRERLGDTEGPQAAELWNSLAVLCDMQERFFEADQAFDRALTLRRQALPQGEADYAHVLKNHAVALMKRGRLAEAEQRLQEALVIQRRLYPGGHADLARTLGSLAALKRQQHDYPRAEALYREALAMAKAAYGPTHSQVAVLLNNSATVSYARSRLTEAEDLLRQALALDSHNLPPDHPVLLAEKMGLGRVLAERGRFGEAQPYLADVVARRRATLPAGHVDLARAEVLLAHTLCERGERKQAFALFAPSVAVLRQAKGAEPWIVAQAEGFWGTCLLRDGMEEQGERLVQGALPVLEAEFGPDSHFARQLRRVR